MVLGLDAGATKTVGLLADDEGTILSVARGGGANLQASGELEVEKVLHSVMEDAQGDRAGAPAVVCVGMAGVDRDEDRRVVHAIMRRIGSKARILVVNDALVALVAALGDAPGIVVIGGTGSIAYGRNSRDEAARSGGWGWVLGDEGSGYWLGRLALRAVVRQADGRGPATALSPLVLAHYDVQQPGDLIAKVYHQPLRPASISALARIVQDAADDGDAVARGLLDRGADELAASAAAVAAALELRTEPFTFVLAGGILRGVPRLSSALMDRLQDLAPGTPIRLLEAEPAVGAVRLAVAEASGRGARIPRYRAGRL
jgi:N-acetylglucosamine kinase-like BadF-type ATPase